MTITHTIGQGGGFSITPDHSSLAAWVTYLQTQSPLTTPHIGRVLWVSAGNELSIAATTIGSITTDGTNTIILEAGDSAGNAGGSFRNHVTAGTNALRYDSSKGAGINHNTTSAATSLTISVNNFTMRNLQFKKTVGGGGDIILSNMLSGVVIDSCIIAATNNIGPTSAFLEVNRISVVNTLVYASDISGAALLALVTGPSTWTNCTFAITDSAITTASSEFMGINSGTAIITNCVGWGPLALVHDFFSNGGVQSGVNNATMMSSTSSTMSGVGRQYLVIGPTEFRSITQGSEDFRIAPTSVKLREKGTTTLAPSTDIIGQSRN